MHEDDWAKVKAKVDRVMDAARKQRAEAELVAPLCKECTERLNAWDGSLTELDGAKAAFESHYGGDGSNAFVTYEEFVIACTESNVEASAWIKHQHDAHGAALHPDFERRFNVLNDLMRGSGK